MSCGGAPGVREVLWRWGAWVTGDPLAAQHLEGRTDPLGALRHLLRVAGSSAPSDARSAAFLHDGARLEVDDIAAVLGCDEGRVHRLIADGRLEEAPPSTYLGPCAAVRLEALVRVDREALGHALTCRECGDARSSLRAGRRAVVAVWDDAGAALASAVVPVGPARESPQPVRTVLPPPLPDHVPDPAGGGSEPEPRAPRSARRRRSLRIGGGHRALAVLAGLPILALVVSGPWSYPDGGPTSSPSMRVVSDVAISPSAPDPPADDEDVWIRLAACQSYGDWTADTGNGHYGGLQFSLESWRLVGGDGMPHEAPPHEQIRRARLLHQLQGWSAWPACATRLSLVS